MKIKNEVESATHTLKYEVLDGQCRPPIRDSDWARELLKNVRIAALTKRRIVEQNTRRKFYLNTIVDHYSTWGSLR